MLQPREGPWQGRPQVALPSLRQVHALREAAQVLEEPSLAG